MKTILAHIYQDDAQEGRLQCALDLTRATGGHLTCVQATPLEYLFAGDQFGGAFVFSEILDTVRAQEQAQQAAIEAQLRKEGVSWDWKRFDGNVVQTLIDQSRLMDVIVLSRPLPGLARAGNPLPIAADVALYCRSPVLVVPPGANGFAPTGAAVVAWNGSAEAANALRMSLTLLKLAETVHVVQVSDEKPRFASSEAAAYLSRHGIACELHEWPAKGRGAASALLHAANELSAAYLVMGAYGHSRLRETILGGVTHDMLHNAEVPLLLAH